MPSFLYNSKVRAVSDHCNLMLRIEHRIDLGRPSDAPRHLNSAALLRSADIVLASDLVMALSGSFAGAKISAEDIFRSHLAKHLVEYLRMVKCLTKVHQVCIIIQLFSQNATQLGLSYVSGVINDQGDDRPKVIIRPTCLNPLRLQHLPTCATLKSLDLAYTWKIPFQQANSNFSPLTGPFAQTLALPYLTLLDEVVERFVKWHLIKRYPLIFGSWRRQLEIETGSSFSIYRSIRSIIDRSDNDTFKEKCENKLMVMKEKLLARTANAAALLYNIAPNHDGHSTTCLRTSMGDEEVLCLAMERLFQAGLQPSKLQMSRLRPLSDRVEDEQLSQSLTPCPTDDSEQRNRKNLWESLPSSPPPNPVDLVNTASSFAHFPLGLYDQRDHWEDVEVHSSLTPDEGTCDWVEVLEDNSQVTEASEICVLPLSADLPNRATGAINPMSGEGYSQGIGDSGTSSATSGTHCHLMDFDNDLLSFNYCRSNNVNDRNGSSEKLIFTLEDDVQNSPLIHHEGSAEDLFAQDKYHGIEIDLEGFDSLGDDSLDNHDYSWGDDNGLLFHAVLESTTDMSSRMGPNGDLHAETTRHVPSSILSAPHLTYHTSDISSSTCSRTDQKESHGSFGDGAAQFKTLSGLSGATVWDHGTGWEPDSEEFIELDADWEEDEHFLNLIDEEPE